MKDYLDLYKFFIILILIILPFLIVKALIGEKKISKNKISKVSKKTELLFTTSLPIVFWGLFIGGNIILNTLIYISKDEFQIFLLIIHLIQIVISVYLIFRNAEIFKKERIKNRENYGQATAAKIATVIIILIAIGNFMITMRS